MSLFSPIDPQTIARSLVALKPAIPKSENKLPSSSKVVIRPILGEISRVVVG